MATLVSTFPRPTGVGFADPGGTILVDRLWPQARPARRYERWHRDLWAPPTGAAVGLPRPTAWAAPLASQRVLVDLVPGRMPDVAHSARSTDSFELVEPRFARIAWFDDETDSVTASLAALASGAVSVPPPPPAPTISPAASNATTSMESVATITEWSADAGKPVSDATAVVPPPPPAAPTPVAAELTRATPPLDDSVGHNVGANAGVEAEPATTSRRPAWLVASLAAVAGAVAGVIATLLATGI